MKIIIISTGFLDCNYEGARTHTLAIASGLSKLKVKLRIYAATRLNCDQHKLIANNQVHFVQQRDYMNNKDYLIIKIIKIIINNVNLLKKIINNNFIYSIIYERFSPVSFSSVLLKLFYNKKIVFEVNGIPDEEVFLQLNTNNKIVRKLISIIIYIQLQQADAIIVQTDELKRIISKKFNVKKVHVIHNGTDLHPKYDIEVNQLPTLLFVGSIDNIHNLDTILKILVKQRMKYIFNIIGEGTLYSKLILKYQFDKRINFLGYLDREDVKKYIRNADICIAVYNPKYSLFKKYGFYLCPIKIFEYMSYGKTTIVYGYYNSILNELTQNNCIITSQSPKSVKSILLNHMINRSLCNAYYQTTLKYVKQYTWKEAAKLTKQVLENL